MLYDAVAILLSADGAALLANDAPSKDFVSDAFAHCKFIGYTKEALPLLEAAGIAAKLDEGCVALGAKKDAAAFIELCGKLRLWDRELSVDLDA